MRWRSNTSNSTLPPIVTTLGIDRVLEHSPNSLMIVNRDREIIYRNAAATETAADVARNAGEHGQEILAQLRQGLADKLKSARTFPYTDCLRVHAGGYEAEAEVRIHQLDDCYLAYWSDVTAARDNARLLRETAEELTTAGISLTELNDRLGADSAHVSSRADAVATGAEEMSASIREISASTVQAVATIEEAVKAAEVASARIDKLNESSVRVGMVSKLINSIAEQTNLLALNATIEAARAGTYGKGFAVVAGEVKELAARTSEATGEIAEMIEAIQSDSNDTSAAIQKINELIGKMEEQQTTVAGAVEEQSATAEEMSHGIAEVAGATQSSTQALSDLRVAVEGLADKARHLTEYQQRADV